MNADLQRELVSLGLVLSGSVIDLPQDARRWMPMQWAQWRVMSFDDRVKFVLDHMSDDALDCHIQRMEIARDTGSFEIDTTDDQQYAIFADKDGDDLVVPMGFWRQNDA